MLISGITDAGVAIVAVCVGHAVVEHAARTADAGHLFYALGHLIRRLHTVTPHIFIVNKHLMTVHTPTTLTQQVPVSFFVLFYSVLFLLFAFCG